MTVRVNKSAFNIREKLSELERPIGLKGNQLMGAETAQDARDLVSAGRKNLIINGDFRISQRGDYSSATSASHSTYYLDRWKTDISGSTATIQRQTVTLPDGTQAYSAKLAASSSSVNAYLQLQQYVEIFPHMQGRTVTISAWVRSNRQVRLRLEATNQNYDGLKSHSGNGNWEYLTQTLTLGTSLSVLKFGAIIWNSSGATTGTSVGTNMSSGDYFEFANYQVEFGKNATEFEHRSYGEELALCQRYFWIVANSRWLMGYKRHDSFIYFQLDTPVPMRISPTPTITSVGILTNHQSQLGGAVQTTGTSVFEYRPDSGRGVLQISSTYTGTHVLIPSWEAGTIEFSAEF